MENLKQMCDYTVDSLVSSKDEKGYNQINQVLYKKAIKEAIDQTVFNVLVMIDNGTSLADHFPIEFIDPETRESLSGNIAFHEFFPDYFIKDDE